MKRTLTILAAITLAAITANAQTLKKSVTWEKICANPVKLPLAGQIQPRESSLDAPSIWSVGCETMDRDYAHFEKFKQYVGQTGIGYARLQSGWAKTEQVKGKYEFEWLDAHVDGLIEEGVHPWICLCYGNPVYSEHGHDLNAKLFADGATMDAWLKYVKAVVKRYKGKVTMYEVWNEPDGNIDSYDLYANLFARTAKVIRKTDPDAKIAAFGICSPERPYIRKALKKIAEMDAIKYMDYLTYHAYWPIPENIQESVAGLKKDVAEYSASIRLLQGETGCPGQLEYGHAMCNNEWTEYSQAKWDLRNMLQHWGMDVPYSVFTMVDLNYGWMMQSYGLLRNNLYGDVQYMRPKFHAVQNVTSIFTPDLKPDGSITAESSCGRRIQCFGISKDGKNVGCMLWFSDHKPSDSLEREATAITLKGLRVASKDLVYVDMLSGGVYIIPELGRTHGAIGTDSISFGELPLWDSPVLLIDKNCLDNVKYNNQ